MTTTFGSIGCGNMGAAILRGIGRREDVQLYGLDLDKDKLEELAGEIGLIAKESARELVEECDYVLIAVKPNQVKALLSDLASRLRPAQTLISIAAGVTLRQLKDYSSGACPIIRVMPNTPAMVQRGVFALCLDDPALNEKKSDFVKEIFSAMGEVHVLGEGLFDAFTAIAGSGPAYVCYFMEALIEAAVSMGFTRDAATNIVMATFSGSTRMAMESDIHLSILREMVCSPKGSTIAAMNSMDSEAVRGKIIEAVKAAWQRNMELGKE